MCVQCMAGAMTAAAGATGLRAVLARRFGHFMTPRRKKAMSVTLVAVGVLVSGIIVPSTG